MTIRVEQVRIYPLKSARTLRKDWASVTQTGFEHDRLAMLVYADGPQKGTFISQRTKGFEKLALMKADASYRDADGGIGSKLHYHFSIHSSKNSGLSVPLPRMISTPHTLVNVWGNHCVGVDGGDTAANFFSNYLGTSVRLMFYPRTAPREADPTYAKKDDITSYADGFPFLITSRPSLQALAPHFPSDVKIGMDRFRPNIVLDGNLPFEEDAMHRIRIGKDVELEIVKPCARCVLTTINQETGERGPNEPLDTLTSLRLGRTKELKGVFFGQNAIPRSLGVINVGDEVEILSTRPMHPALEQAALRFEG